MILHAQHASPSATALVCLPWHTLESPSIQLGTLHASLERARLPVRSHSLHLAFQDFLEVNARDIGFSLDDYALVATRLSNLGAGEWVFALPPQRAERPGREQRYARFLRANGVSHELLAKLAQLRARVPEFLERCADEVLASRPRVVGFTAVYSQLWPSAALAHVLREREPGLVLVVGGASAEGSMGPAILRAFPAFDAVVQGEAEELLPELVRAVTAREAGDTASRPSLPALPGTCVRACDGVLETPRDSAVRIDVETLPEPVYDEYFERLARSPLAQALMPQVPLESSRGCWWGEKHHCTFCGLNGLEMRYRSKSAGKLLAEIDALAARHGVLDFVTVDNIIDTRYFRTLLPELARRGRDYGLFYETKANLTAPQVLALRDAGVRAIQPGIESLSTPVLQHMRKGVTALQNVRLLKWCARYGVRVIWNLLYGFPGEDPQEYARMAQLVPALAHLPAPELSRLMIYRFSPYHDDPARFGLRLREPLPCYEFLYDVDASVRADLAQAFEVEYADGRDPERTVAELREAVSRWQRDAERNQGALTYRRGPDFLVITDTRTTTTRVPIRYELGPREAEVYLACESGATRAQLLALGRDSQQGPLGETELDHLLDELRAARLVVDLDGRTLSLAQPRFAETADPWICARVATAARADNSGAPLAVS